MPSESKHGEDVLKELQKLRAELEPAFRPDTAAKGFPSTRPSGGHCAAVSAIIHELFGGEFVSAYVEGLSHWFNRIQVNGRWQEIDITGDQFGREVIQVGTGLYDGVRKRRFDELNDETLSRARLLATRAGLDATARALEEELRRRAHAEEGKEKD